MINPGDRYYTVREAAGKLGVSPGTLKQMIARGELVTYRTPGGHLRVSIDAPEAARDRTHHAPQTAVDVLADRLTAKRLEIEERRLDRELQRLNEEDAANRTREDESEFQRAPALRADEERRERIAAFRDDLSRHALSKIPRELPPDWRLRLLQEIDEIILRERPGSGGLPYTLIEQKISAAISECAADAARRRTDDAIKLIQAVRSLATDSQQPPTTDTDQERRARMVSEESFRLCLAGTDEGERVEAESCAWEALDSLLPNAPDSRIRAAIAAAMLPIGRKATKRKSERERKERARWEIWMATHWKAPRELTDAEAAAWEQAASQAVNTLAPEATESEIEAAIEGTIKPLRKAWLIGQAHDGIPQILRELEAEGEIEDSNDPELMEELPQAVTEELQETLTGDEDRAEVSEIVREIIVDQLEL